jgi:hypothetical protein
MERTKQATKDAYQKAKAFDEKHRVMERTGKKLASAAAFISKQLQDDKKSNGVKNGGKEAATTNANDTGSKGVNANDKAAEVTGEAPPC